MSTGGVPRRSSMQIWSSSRTIYAFGGNMILGLIGWIVVGLVVGFVTSKIIDLHGDDPRLGIAVACGGAILAATVYTLLSRAGVSAWNMWSLMFAAVGAMVGLVVWHAVRSRYVSRAPYTRRSSY